jgi:putative flippase GtrA
MKTLLKVFSRYPTYFLVGVGVTLLTILIRSLIGWIVKDDSTSKYLLTIILTYIIGIYLSFVGHKTFTFKVEGKLTLLQVLRFIGIHVVGMFITLIVSVKLREFCLDIFLTPELSKMTAFALSAILVSMITYVLKKRIVFH